MAHSTSKEEQQGLTSPDGSDRTFWFQGEGGAPIPDASERLRQGMLPAASTSHLYYLIIIGLLFGLYGVEFTSRRLTRPHQPPLPSQNLTPLCGSSVEEALALGCVFDVYVNGWLPAACYDAAVAKESESNSSDIYPVAGGRTTFPIYRDLEMTKRATVEDLMTAAFINGEDGFDIRFHIAYEYHRAHCLHLWRLSVSALERLSKGERSVGVYYKAASPAHAWHCNKIILDGDGRDPEKKDTITPGVGRCVGLDDTWNNVYGWAGRRVET